MAKQTVVWTALPNGGEGGTLRLSVFVSPRLEAPAPATLSQFPDFLKWADVPIQFVVRFDGGLSVPATRRSPAPDSALWQALFKPGIGVQPFNMGNLDLRPILSYPVKHVQAFLKGIYQNAAVTSPTEFLPVASILRDPEGLVQIGFYRDPPVATATMVSPPRDQQIITQIQTQLKRTRAIPPSPTPNPPQDFVQLRMFHTPLSALNPAKPGEFKRAAIEVPKLDFHQIVSSLGDYPELLRRLGLVIDIEFAAPPGLPASTRVWVEPKWNPSANVTTQDVTPKTKCVTSGRFAAEPKGDGIVGGLLRLQDPQKPASAQVYDLVQIDVDGAAMKAMTFADNLLRGASPLHRTADTPKAVSMPATRSAGIALAKLGRAMDAVEAIAQARQLDNAVKANPSADVTLYAEDITRGYRIDIRDGTSDRWRSLCKRVGKYAVTGTAITLLLTDEGFIAMGLTGSPDGSTDRLNLSEMMVRWDGWSLVAPRPGLRVGLDMEPEKYEPQSVPDFGLLTEFEAAPGTLPRLRFGAGYQLRARVTDLAGNSLSLEEADALMGTQMAAAVTLGEGFRYLRFEPVSSPTVVLRNPVKELPGESLERIVIRSYNDDPAKDSVKTTEESQRHIAPPLGAQLTAETHGMFDKGGALDKGAYDLIVAREGTLTTGGATDEAVHPEAQLKLPYLPDPLSRGAAFRGLPGTAANEMTQVAFDGAWPDAQPFRLRVVEGTGAPTWDAASRVLTVHLPKATAAPVRLSSFIAQRDLAVMGIWQWIEESSATPARKDALRKVALQGRHWMITPFRELTFVHAVQQPIGVPNFAALSANRGIGDTYAMLYGDIEVDGKSALKLDLEARWEEPIDPLAESRWKTISGQSHAFELPLAPTVTVEKFIRKRHEFGDTKYRKVRYRAVSTSRFRDCFPFTDAEIASGAKKITRESAEFTLDILNSARPDAPKVLYVIPSFDWERRASSDGVKSTRRGGGLRVYLERPWFVSGEGELLAVVIPSAPAGRTPLLTALPTPISAKAAPYVTQWGADPIWRTQATTSSPRLEDFRNAVQSEAGLTLDEVDGVSVTAVGHAVQYDEDRQLWFCDIDIDPGESYYPFVRLALARYQPMSVKAASADVKLSRVVLADFAQLAPDRAAAVTFDAANKRLLSVSVTGVGYQGSPMPGDRVSEMEVVVETRRGRVESDLGWVPAAEGVFPLTATPISDRRWIWQGAVTLPADRGSQPFRLVIKEYERLPVSDAPVATLTAMAVPQPQRRLVYADAIEV